MSKPTSEFGGSLSDNSSDSRRIRYSNVPRETFQKTGVLVEENRPTLKKYTELLLWWNKRVNLVSRDVSRETIEEHIHHSLLLTQFEAFQNADIIVDAGTGGGLPGIPLAIAYPKKQFILNDIATKKILAVRDICRKLALDRVQPIDVSIGELEAPSSFLLVSKHAFKVHDLWEMVSAKPWSEMIFYKGLEFEDELVGIEEQVQLTCFDLSEGPEFYNGKALLFLRR